MSESNAEPIADQAQQALGSWETSSDWRLEPQAHAARLSQPAAALSRVLSHSAIEAIMQRYATADEDANTHQKVYKRLGELEVFLGTAAALVGAIVLMMTDSETLTPAMNKVRMALVAVQILSASGLLAVKYLQRQRNVYSKWQQARARAETARIELFETVCGLTPRKWTQPQEAEGLPLLPLQLEYFLRYQFAVQLAYYDERGAQHRKASEKYIGMGAFMTFLAALAAGVLSMSQELGDFVSIAALIALAAPLLLTAQTSLSRLHQDERNAARYEITFRHLQRTGEDITDVRAAAAAGREEPVHRFIRQVNEVISVEHSQWLLQQQLREQELEQAPIS